MAVLRSFASRTAAGMGPETRIGAEQVCPLKESALWRRRCGVAKKLSMELPHKESFDEVLASGVAEEYKILGKLGSGAFGSVHCAKDLACGRIVALKTASSNDAGATERTQLEYDFLKQLAPHPHIIEAIDLRGPTLVMEFFDGLTLHRACEGDGLAEPNVSIVGAALFKAVAYLHAHKVLHRDVKPQNVLVSRCLRDLRLIDFNAAASFRDGQPLTPTGTQQYKAPEVLLGQPHSTRSDVWASALCIFFSLTGKLPEGRTFRGPYAHVLMEAASQPIMLDGSCWQNVSNSCKTMLRGCLAVNPEDRPESAESLLEHTWIISSFACLGASPASPGKFMTRQITEITEVPGTDASCTDTDAVPAESPA